MARLAAARTQAASAVDLIDSALFHFVEGEDDGGDQRGNSLEAAELAGRELVESLELAREGNAQLSREDLQTVEADIAGNEEDPDEEEDDEDE